MANLTLRRNDDEVKTFAISPEEEENIATLGKTKS